MWLSSLRNIMPKDSFQDFIISKCSLIRMTFICTEVTVIKMYSPEGKKCIEGLLLVFSHVFGSFAYI